jgi:hypothetical protein
VDSKIGQGFTKKQMPTGFKSYLGRDNQFYISNCVLSGKYYPENGKPAFLQSSEYSNILDIVGDKVGLVLNFALGKEGDFYKNKTVTHYGTTSLEVPGEKGESKSYYVWAELTDVVNCTLEFGFSPKSELVDGSWNETNEYYFQTSEPTNPVVGDHWYNTKTNVMKHYDHWEEINDDGEQVVVENWVEKNRIILGLIGVGTDNYVYSITSYPLRKDFADIYPEYTNYDGVSFQTDGEYIAMNVDDWITNQNIVDNILISDVAKNAVYNNEIAMNTICEDDYFMGEIFNDTEQLNTLISFNDIYTKMFNDVAVPLIYESDLLNSYWTGNIYEFGDNYVSVYVKGPGTRVISISRKIDLSKYSSIKIDWRNTFADGFNNSQFKVGGNTLISREDQFGRRIESYDVSNINEPVTISVFNIILGTARDYWDSKIDVYGIWGVK